MKGILASVGIARGFDAQGNMIIHGNTLTDSGFNISSSKEEIRGGEGGGLQGQFYHTSQFIVNLKDALFDLQYLALQVGGKIKKGGDVFTSEQCVLTSGGITVQGTPKAFGGYGTVGWYNHAGKDDYTKVEFSGKKATGIKGEEGDIICVTYVETSDSARAFEVATSYIPSEIHLVQELPIYSATAKDASNVSTESKIGVMIVDIPRFQFNGSIDLSTSMTSPAGIDVSGMALQSGASSCSGKGIYATITEIYFGQDAFTNVANIAVVDNDIELKSQETHKLQVMAIYNDGTVPSLIDNSKLTFTVKSGGQSYAKVDGTGLITAQSAGDAIINIEVTGKTELDAVASVHVTGA